MLFTARFAGLTELGQGVAENADKDIYFNFKKNTLRRPRSPGHCASAEPGLRGENSVFGLPRVSRGFSLIEVCLALMVVGVGILSVLSLFPTGLDQNARSISDTHAALFAEDVFGSLRAQAEANWQEIGNSIQSVPVAGTTNWWIPEDGGFSNYLDNTVHTNVFRNPANSNVVDHALRYRISITTNGLLKGAMLRVWQGAFGPTNNPTMFYTEFFRLNQ